MEHVRINASGFEFIARFESERAPQTCAKFRTMLPYKERIIHVRWSGEGCWIPLGELDLGLKYENHTSYPAPGEIIIYPGGISETEILLAYGNASADSSSVALDPLIKGVTVVQAQTGPSHVLGGADRLRPAPRTVPWRMTILWLALGLGVVLLAWMVYRLSRELGSGGTEKRQ